MASQVIQKTITIFKMDLTSSTNPCRENIFLKPSAGESLSILGERGSKEKRRPVWSASAAKATTSVRAKSGMTASASPRSPKRST